MEKILYKEKGSILTVSVLFVAVFLVFLGLLFNTYYAELRGYERIYKQYISGVAARDVMSVIAAIESSSMVSGAPDFLHSLVQKTKADKGMVFSSADWLQCSPLYEPWAKYFPNSAFYVGANTATDDKVEISVLAVQPPKHYSLNKVLYRLLEAKDALKGHQLPLVGIMPAYKTYIKFGIFVKGLYTIGTMANIGIDYGPYARVSGDLVFKRVSGAGPLVFWGIPPAGRWIIKDKQGNIISTGNNRNLMDSVIKGRVYYGGEDIRVVNDDEQYSYLNSFENKVNINNHFAIVSHEDYNNESDARENTPDIYVYDPQKDKWLSTIEHSPTDRSQNTVKRIYYDVIFQKGIEIQSQYAIDISNYVFGSTDLSEPDAPSDPWERLVTSFTYKNSALYRANHDNNVFKVSSLDFSTSGGIDVSYFLFEPAYMGFFYVDTHGNTHLIVTYTDAAYFDEEGIGYIDGLEYGRDVAVYDINLTDMSHDKKKIFVYFDKDFYIIPPCSFRVTNRGLQPILGSLELPANGLPICMKRKIGRYTVYELNPEINGKARELAYNPNWKYEWTHYIYPLTPAKWTKIKQIRNWPDFAMFYQPNWQNVNMYNMALTIAVNGNIHILSSIVFQPEGEGGTIKYFEQDYQIANKDLQLNVDLPSALQYPKGKIMAMYARKNVWFDAYICGDNNYYDYRNYLVCRGITMYGFRFPYDSLNQIPASFKNYSALSRSYLHSWDTLLYSYVLALTGQIGLDYYYYSMESFKKLGSFISYELGGMVCPTCDEGSEGYIGNRYYIHSLNPITNPPAYWLLPPKKWWNVSIQTYRTGH